MKVFDFDNTIYNGESTIDFFNYVLERKEKYRKYKGLVTKLYFLYKHNLLPMKLMKHYIAKYSSEKVDFNKEHVLSYIDEFWKENKDKLDKDMLKKISKEDVIITANLDVLINPIKKELKTKNIITSIVDLDKKEIKFLCYNENKLAKFKELYKDKEIDELYTDSYSDKPLMSISKKVFLVDKENNTIKCIKGE